MTSLVNSKQDNNKKSKKKLMMAKLAEKADDIQKFNLDERDIMRNCVRNTTRQFREHGYHWMTVGWDDCARASYSSIGPNISDWSFKIKDGPTLKFIRKSNFEDKTLTIKAKDLAIVVGNETVGGNLKAVTFQHYLENYGKYTPKVPDSLNLSSGPEELVTVRFIAVIVPENSHGYQEVVPTCYNYQTTDKSNPRNFIGASFHMGVGSRMDGPACENVYLVKTNDDSTCDDSWFRITNESKENEEQKAAVATVLGTRSTGSGRNRVQCFQIPRKMQRVNHYRSYNPKIRLERCSVPKLNVGNVSYGSSAGTYSAKFPEKLERDKSQNITVTFAEYWTTKDGNLTEGEVDQIIQKLESNYHDIKGEWLGSLVTGKQDTSLVSNSGPMPPIKLPELTMQDKEDFNYKVTHFPKDLKDVQAFPNV